MKFVFVASLWVLACATSSHAQERIYRCGNEYTNTVQDPQTKGCKLLETGNVTVVQGTRPAASAPARWVASASAQRVDPAEQKARDSDSLRILEAELRKAQERQVDLQKEYNGGDPERRSDEVRNNQKYQERVASLKASLARNESDIAGIRRELSRASPASAAK